MLTKYCGFYVCNAVSDCTTVLHSQWHWQCHWWHTVSVTHVNHTHNLPVSAHARTVAPTLALWHTSYTRRPTHSHRHTVAAWPPTSRLAYVHVFIHTPP